MKKLFLPALTVISLLACGIYFSQSTNAIDGSYWRAGRIIDDSLFTNGYDMSTSDIQNFLNKKVPVCDTNGQGTSDMGGIDYNGDGRITRREYAKYRGYGDNYIFTCLKDFYEVPKSTSGGPLPANNYGGKPIPAGAQSAAQLISNAAVKYRINPKALLIKIATESPGPLTSDDWPFEKQYTYAMGAHCPDTPQGHVCDPNWGGFSLQIDEAAALLRSYLDNMEQPWWPYKKPYQVNNILIQDVNVKNCGSTGVYIESKATAALYTYTPYQPNQAALSNMYGTGDSCSTYGNRNFWRAWNDWFGPSLTDPATSDRFAHPDGTLVRYLTDPAVYLIVNGEKRHIPSVEIFESYKFTFPDVKAMTTGDLRLPTGTPYAQFRSGVLLKLSNDSNYYQVYGLPDGSQRVKTLSPDVAQQLGYKNIKPILVAPGQMPQNDGQPATKDTVHPNGTLVIDPRNLYVYLIDNGQLRHIPSPYTLFSYRYNFNDPIVANSADQQLPIGSPMPFREGQLVVDAAGYVRVANTIDSTGQGELRHIPAYFIFTGLRYTWNDVLPQDVSNIPLGTQLQPQF